MTRFRSFVAFLVLTLTGACSEPAPLDPPLTEEPAPAELPSPEVVVGTPAPVEVVPAREIETKAFRLQTPGRPQPLDL